jgi:hypothetical protein
MWRTTPASLKRLFGLDGEADGYVGFAVESLKQMIADQAMKLALTASLGNQFNATVAGIAFRTADIGLSHAGGSYHFAPMGPTVIPKADHKNISTKVEI